MYQSKFIVGEKKQKKTKTKKKKTVENVGCASAYFCGGHKNTVGL